MVPWKAYNPTDINNPKWGNPMPENAFHLLFTT